MLTAKQQIVYDFIKGFIEEKNYSPSIREICKGLGIKSNATIHAHLLKLEKQGYIKRETTMQEPYKLKGNFKNDVLFLQYL